MNGRDVADAMVDQQQRTEVFGFLDWIKASLAKKRAQGIPLNGFEQELLWRIEKLEGM